MKCKYCNVDVEDGVTVCPVCGKDLSAEEETVVQMPDLQLDEAGEAVPAEAVDQTPELTPYTQTTFGEAMDAQPQRGKKAVIFLCVLGAIFSVLLVVGSVVGILFALDILPLRENDIYFRDNYTVTDQKVLENADKVVATICDHTLTNSELQIYYWWNTTNYLYQNQYSLSAMGFDYTKPFHEQTFFENRQMNWQQAFLEKALDYWHRYTVLYQMATDAGFKLDANTEKMLNDLPESMKATATQYGYSSLDEMFKAELGPTCDIEMYTDYMRVYYIAIEYYTELYMSNDPSINEIEAFFTEHEGQLAENQVTKDSGRLVDVRHILLEPKDTDEDKTISDAEWEACRQEAQTILDQWLAGEKSEESFAALANQYSADPGSNTKGGLYTDVLEGDMVEEFDAWLFDENRQKEDYGLVKTKFGYHIMFYSDSEDIWIYVCRESIREEKANQILEEAMEQNSPEINYKNIYLCDIKIAG